MGDTVVIVICIIIGAVMMFVFPMLALSSDNNKIAQVTVQSATAEFVATISSTGEITAEETDKFIQTLYSTGNSYDVDFEVQVSDSSEDKKTTTVNPIKQGEQDSYSIFTNEIMEKVRGPEGKFVLKKGDIVIVTAKNSNQTLFQTLQAVFYSTTSDSYQIASKQAAVVGTSGQ